MSSRRARHKPLDATYMSVIFCLKRTNLELRGPALARQQPAGAYSLASVHARSGAPRSCTCVALASLAQIGAPWPSPCRYSTKPQQHDSMCFHFRRFAADLVLLKASLISLQTYKTGRVRAYADQHFESRGTAKLPAQLTSFHSAVCLACLTRLRSLTAVAVGSCSDRAQPHCSTPASKQQQQHCSCCTGQQCLTCFPPAAAA